MQVARMGSGFGNEISAKRAQKCGALTHAHGAGRLKRRGLRSKIERGVSVGYGTRRRESKNGRNLSLMACYIEKSQLPGTDAEQSWKGDQVMTWVKLRPEWRMIF